LGSLFVNNSTVSGNSAKEFGAGVYNEASSTVKNTILANNTSGGNCFASGSLISEGHNLADDNTCASFFTAIGDLNNSPAGLDSNGLQNNGGSTQTIALLPTSAAVDKIPVEDCTTVAGMTVTTDQRGVPRPQGAACDIGAYELGGEQWTFCAPEGGLCAFTGTTEVRYGANGVYVYLTLTDGTACTNAVFGDPIYGTVKECATRIPPDQTEWTFCAVEGGECAFTGVRDVRYGANGVYVYQTLLDGTACNNQVFGDPLYGVVKSCSLRTASGSLLTAR